MTIDIETVKRLKDLTGVGLTDAKQALEASHGDFDVALSAMRQKGLTKAEKRSAREARAGIIGTYNHDSRIGVLVEVNCETDFVARNELFVSLVKDLCLHVAATDPLYLSLQAVPESERSRVEAEFNEQVKPDNKPAALAKSIVSSKMEKYFKEKCLNEQPFVKNPDQTVGDYVKDHAARLGENVVVKRFVRFALGENLD